MKTSKMKRFLLPASVACTLALGSMIYADDATKGASTPEDALATMRKHAATGDVAATFGVMIDEQRKPLVRWYESQTQLAGAINAFVDAADAKFGVDPKSTAKKVKFDAKKEIAQGFKGVSLVGKPTKVDDTHVDLKVSMTFEGPDGKEVKVEEKVEAVKQADGWKLVFVQLKGVKFDDAVTFMNGMRSGLERATKGIKDGSTKDRESAMKECEKDRPKSIPGNVPMPRFLTRQG